ncbi:MAG: hypothetical protein AB7T31_06045 [Gemmatimonadales bacterium]
MMEARPETEGVDPGVPGALGTTLTRLRERVGVEMVDRLWIFPPFRRGRREQGLIAVSTFHGDAERRGVVTVTYSAEETGKGITVEPSITREGEAPPDRFPILMRGVVQRGGEERGEPREVEIEGSVEKFEQLLEELGVAPAEPGRA